MQKLEEEHRAANLRLAEAYNYRPRNPEENQEVGQAIAVLQLNVMRTGNRLADAIQERQELRTGKNIAYVQERTLRD